MRQPVSRPRALRLVGLRRVWRLAAARRHPPRRHRRRRRAPGSRADSAGRGRPRSRPRSGRRPEHGRRRPRRPGTRERPTPRRKKAPSRSTTRSLVKDPDKGKALDHGRSPADADARSRRAGSAARRPPPRRRAAVPDGAPRGGGEAEWQETARRARKRVDGRARPASPSSTATAKKLENDFYAWDDGQYRDRVIKPAWDRARSELEDGQAASSRRPRRTSPTCPSGRARPGRSRDGSANDATTLPVPRRTPFRDATGSRPGAAR